MENYFSLLVVLITLLLGLILGKAWERYKLRQGRWIDRRKARESPHYILGLNFLVANQLDPAIEQLRRAADLAPDVLEIHMILGNLHREKGQIGRAIQVHQSLLQKPTLTKLEHAYVMLCLGLDFKQGGFVDRAREAFNDVLRLDPENQFALLNLEKLHEEQRQWDLAYQVRQQLIQISNPEQLPRDREILAFIENELGLQALRRTDHKEAAKHFLAAIELDEKATPAYLNLGDVELHNKNLSSATETWERMIRIAPERAYLTFDRLEAAYSEMEQPQRFTELCHQLIAANPQDWRARLALAQYKSKPKSTEESLELLLEALTYNPHALSIHQAIWETLLNFKLQPDLVQRYVRLTRQSIFYMDPHICIRCRYRSTELLWQCPHCHEWNTFVEERIAPAKETREEEEQPM